MEIEYKGNKYKFDKKKADELGDSIEWLEKTETAPITAINQFLELTFGLDGYNKFVNDNCIDSKTGKISAKKIIETANSDEFQKAVNPS
jgi:hypothetical protein